MWSPYGRSEVKILNIPGKKKKDFLIKVFNFFKKELGKYNKPSTNLKLV